MVGGNQSRAVMVFVKNPEPGKVKTRLAADMGDERALSVYMCMADITITRARTTDADMHIFFSSDIPSRWPFSGGSGAGIGAALHRQRGDDLGERMQNAFRDVFESGYERVVIVGSDCPELTKRHLGDAFTALDNHDVVIGPARDGGYYLLGMKSLHDELFVNKSWSTATVFHDTRRDARRLGLAVAELEVLSDVDTFDDFLRVRHLLDEKQC